MITNGRVVVPLDGSEAGEDALPFAEAIARRERLLLHLLSVVPAEAAIARAHQHHQRQLELSVRRAREHYLHIVACRIAHDGLAASTEVAIGDPAERILHLLSEQPVRLVALSTHGRGGVERLLLCSVADKVMRLSPVPVLLARRLEDHTPQGRVELRRIAVPLDGSEAAEAAISEATGLLDGRGTLCLVRVVPWLDPQDNHYLPGLDTERLDQELHADAHSYLERIASCMSPGVRTCTSVLRGNVAPALRDWTRENGIDLVVMTTHGLGGWRRLLVGSVAERLVRWGVLSLLLRLSAERSYLLTAPNPLVAAVERETASTS